MKKSDYEDLAKRIPFLPTGLSIGFNCGATKYENVKLGISCVVESQLESGLERFYHIKGGHKWRSLARLLEKNPTIAMAAESLYPKKEEL